jgi:hypothetical protein
LREGRAGELRNECAEREENEADMKTKRKEFLYTADQWKAALQRVGVSKEDIIEAHTILVNEDIEKLRKRKEREKS